MTAVVPEQEHRTMSPHEYLSNLNKTAIRALAMGAPLGLVGHVTFLLDYINAWLDQVKDTAEEAEKAARAVFDRAPLRIQQRISQLLGSGGMPRRVLLARLLFPLVLQLAVVMPWVFTTSLGRSAWDMLRRGIHGVPPLITAVVVVFVTSDAWRILGNGFTVRFAVVAAMFLVASLLFLIHRNCWLDIDAEHAEALDLLASVRHGLPKGFNEFTRLGIKAAPMVRPSGRRACRIYLSYWALTAFALIITAGFVASALIVIGAILISQNETVTLDQSVDVYLSFPGGLVITMQLLSLSLSLGAFAAFFLVAAQRPEDRDAFMKDVLARYRQALLVYSLYCRARDRAPELTQVCPHVRPLQPAANCPMTGFEPLACSGPGTGEHRGSSAPVKPLQASTITRPR
jgi:hypothetical protein